MTKTIAEILEEQNLVIFSYSDNDFCVKTRDTKKVVVIAHSLPELIKKLHRMYG